MTLQNQPSGPQLPIARYLRSLETKTLHGMDRVIEGMKGIRQGTLNTFKGPSTTTTITQILSTSLLDSWTTKARVECLGTSRRKQAGGFAERCRNLWYALV